MASLMFIASSTNDTAPYDFTWWSLPQLALGLVPIALRRVNMLAAVSLLIVATAFSAFTSWDFIAADGTAYLILTYTAAVHLTPRWSIVTGLIVWITATAWIFVVNGFWDPTSSAYAMVAVNWAMGITSYFIGWIVRYRKQRLHELTERTHIAEATQAALAEQAVGDERRRIARELHDVVAHHLAVIGVMAEGARRSFDSQPDKSKEALDTVSETAREALNQMRSLLTVLRSSEEPETQPLPTLDSIRSLVAQNREAGLPLKYTVKGDYFDLHQGASLAVYRIVQEALTNIIKHVGHNAQSEVILSYEPQQLSVRIINDVGDGAHSPQRAGGHGIIGMRERAHLYGGTLSAEVDDHGGFAVTATFPRAHAQDPATLAKAEQL
nr:sensor histidine kinase [Haloglycomyces albus]